MSAGGSGSYNVRMLVSVSVDAGAGAADAGRGRVSASVTAGDDCRGSGRVSGIVGDGAGDSAGAGNGAATVAIGVGDGCMVVWCWRPGARWCWWLVIAAWLDGAVGLLPEVLVLTVAGTLMLQDARMVQC